MRKRNTRSKLPLCEFEAQSKTSMPRDWTNEVNLRGRCGPSLIKNICAAHVGPYHTSGVLVSCIVCVGGGEGEVSRGSLTK